MKNKLFISLLATLSLGVSSLFAQTTMCFKENHLSMSTIESTNLDGGVCAGKQTAQQMKKAGWEVDDIEISTGSQGKNYIYIFKKEVKDTAMYGNEAAITAAVLAKLEVKKQKEIKDKKILDRKNMLERGKNLYTSKCQDCHGQKGEKEAYNTSLPINTFSAKEFKRAIRDLNNGEDKGMAMIMRPYASILTVYSIEDIHEYLQSVNGKTKE